MVTTDMKTTFSKIEAKVVKHPYYKFFLLQWYSVVHELEPKKMGI